MKHVLVADDHEITRRGLEELLRDLYEECLVSTAADSAQLGATLAERTYDLIILDVKMPGGTVVANLAQIRKVAPETPVLVVTAVTELEVAAQALKGGANGFIRKDRAADELGDAIHRVMAGERYLHPDTAARVAVVLADGRLEPPHGSLSDREFQIFCAIAEGLAVKEVAGKLGLSDKTVATYLGRIREKTGLTSHVDIARYAMRYGLVE